MTKKKNNTITSIQENTVLMLTLLVLFFVVIYHRWFFSLDIFTWGDWGFYHPGTIKEWLTFPRLWIDSYGLGMVDLGLSLYVPARLFYGLIANIGASVLVDRLVYLFPGVLLPVVGVFLLTKSLVKNNIASCVASIVYNLNTYVLLLNSGHLTLSISFSLFPYIFLFFKKALEKKSLTYAIICGFFSIFASAYEVRAFYLGAVLLLLYLVYYLLLSGNLKRSFRWLLLHSLLASVPIFMTATSNLYWFLGFLKTVSSFSGIVFNRELYGIGLLPLQRVLTLFSPYWTGSHILAWGQIQPLPYYFWLIPVFVIMGMWFGRHNKQLIFWMIVYLLGSFLAKLTGEPFSQVYAWLYHHFPGFNAFRESSKFNLYVSLSSGILIASFVTQVLNSGLNKSLKYLMTLVVFGIFVFNAWPVFTGDLARLLTPRHIPSDYQIFKNHIQNQSEYFRTLYVPADSRWGYWDQLHPKASLAELVRNEWKSTNNYQETGFRYSSEEEIIGLLEKSNADSLLDDSSIKYVVIPPIDLENEDPFTFMYAPRTNFIDRVSKLSYLSQVDIGTKDLLVYENQGYKQQIYSPDLNTGVKYAKISTTEYQVYLPDDFSGRLVLSQAFNSGWKVRIGEFSWWQSIWNPNYYLSETIHKTNASGLNEFTLNPNHSYSQITLYFSPQAWVNLGTIISSSFFFIYLYILCRLVRR